MTGSNGFTALIARLTERARQLAQSRVTQARPLFTSLPAKD